MKPPISYYGGKMRLAPWIVSLLPPHRVYIEPFFGSGSVLFAKQPARHEIVNDLDGNVVTFFRVLRDHPEEFTQLCALTPYARDEFRAARIRGEDLTDIERARRFWVRCQQGFNQCANESSRSTWATSSIRGSNMATTAGNAVARFLPAAARLSSVSIENDDACRVIERYACDDAVIYLDPPYDPTTRSRARDYAHEFTVDDHRRLAKVLHETPGTVLLSGYASELYEELYAGWHRLERRVTRPSANHGTEKRHAVEVVWSNRLLADGLFAQAGA